MEVSRKIYEGFFKKCSKCKSKRLVPNKHSKCLSCLHDDLNLKPEEAICLSCGKKVKKMPEGHKICPECLLRNLKTAKAKLFKTLTEEQKVLWKEYVLWDEAYGRFAHSL